MPPVSARDDFKPAQQRALALLRDRRATALTRGGYEALCGVSRSQAAYDLAELVEAGLLERVGGGRTTHYVLVREPSSTRRHWTSERIRAELAQFCVGRSIWPSAREFKAVGRGDLYVAASRYGGVAYWAAELGLRRAPLRWETPSFRRLRLSLSWAMIGAVGGAVAAGAAFAIVEGFPKGAPARVAQHARTAVPPVTSPAKPSAARTHKPTKRVAPVKAKPAKQTRTHRAHPAVKTSSNSGGTAVLTARTVSSSPSPATSAPTSRSTSSSSSAPARTTSSSSASSSSGPSPLMAPRQTSSTPPPLPPP